MPTAVSNLDSEHTSDILFRSAVSEGSRAQSNRSDESPSGGPLLALVTKSSGVGGHISRQKCVYRSIAMSLRTSVVHEAPRVEH